MGSQPHPTVLVVGDSISNHWMEALPVALGSAASCSGGSDWSASDWSAGRGTGCDSTQALAYLSSTLHPDGTLPDVLLLNCGLHDIKCAVADGRHQVEPEQYQQNLEAILELFQTLSTKLCWVSTTPVCTGPDGTTRTAPSTSYADADFDRSNEMIDEYNAIAAALMRRESVPIIDLHSFSSDAFSSVAQRGTYDSVHFTPTCRHQQAVFIANWLGGNGVVPGLQQPVADLADPEPSAAGEQQPKL